MEIIAKEDITEAPLYCVDCQRLQSLSQRYNPNYVEELRVDCGECNSLIMTLVPDDQGCWEVYDAEPKTLNYCSEYLAGWENDAKETIKARLDNIMTDDEIEEIKELIDTL